MSDAPPRTPSETTGLDPELKRRINWLVNLAVVALVGAVYNKVEACRTKDEVVQVKERAAAAAEKAEEAAAADRKTYTDVKEKLEPTGDSVADIDERLRVIETKTKGVEPPSEPLPAAVTQPLPEPPAADGGPR